MAKEKEKAATPVDPPPAAPPEGGYETIDSEEAAKYLNAGGRMVSIVRQFPKNPFKSGKRYRFVETKTELERLVKQEEEGA